MCAGGGDLWWAIGRGPCSRPWRPAAAARCRPADLIELVWGDEAPANGLKSLQVLVSRARTACGAEAIVRDGAGYRLGAVPAEVDSARLSALARDARDALDRDAAAAAALAREALELTAGLPAVGDDELGPLAEVRRRAAADAAEAQVTLARASSRTGAHAEALPALEAAHAERPQDEALLADLLHSEAVVRGPAAALERFARYQRELRDRLGADPGELLQRAYRGLLALDRPVRRGVRYEATTLIGRDGDLERLRALLAGARVVSVVGPGGLGKTRLAHAIARTAAEPAVHVVELVGVTAADDLAGEVGSALGVRDSVSGRRALTPQQRADVRARIAQLLGQSPSLLVLDNCEHLIEAVAGLVAFLVTATAGPARARHQPGAARDRRRARLPARRARRGRRRPAVRGAGGRPPGRACSSPSRSSPASSPAWTACRWRSSWPPPGCGR